MTAMVLATCVFLLYGSATGSYGMFENTIAMTAIDRYGIIDCLFRLLKLFLSSIVYAGSPFFTSSYHPLSPLYFIL